MVLLVVSTLMALAAVAVVWSSSSGGPADSSWGSVGSGGAGPIVTTWEPGERPTPDRFTAGLLDGSRIDSAELAGRPVVVNVWGSWCAPCREEAPVLASVARDLRGRVAFLGVNVRDNEASARAFERRFDIPYPSVTTEDSAQVLLAFGGVLTAAAVPSTVVLDAEGQVAARVVGTLDETSLRGLVEDAGGPRDPTIQ